MHARQATSPRPKCCFVFTRGRDLFTSGLKGYIVFMAGKARRQNVNGWLHCSSTNALFTYLFLNILFICVYVSV